MVRVLFILQFKENSQAAAFALEGLIIHGAKNWFNWPRPAVRFPEFVRTIDGNALSQWKAFPRQTNLFNPISLQKLHFQIYESMKCHKNYKTLFYSSDSFY